MLPAAAPAPAKPQPWFLSIRDDEWQPPNHHMQYFPSQNNPLAARHRYDLRQPRTDAELAECNELWLKLCHSLLWCYSMTFAGHDHRYFYFTTRQDEAAGSSRLTVRS